MRSSGGAVAAVSGTEDSVEPSGNYFENERLGGETLSAPIERLLNYDGTPPSTRQRLFRELNGLALTMRLIHEVQSTPSPPASPGTRGASGDKAGTDPVQETMSPYAARLARLGYQILAVACRGQPESQSRLSKFLPMLITHCPLRVGAASTVLAILQSDRRLLESCVSGDLLHFVYRELMAHDQRPEYLTFLRHMVVCEGSPIDHHQVSVCELLWSDAADPKVGVALPLLSLRSAVGIDATSHLKWEARPPPKPSVAQSEAAAARAAAAAFSIPESPDNDARSLTAMAEAGALFSARSDMSHRSAREGAEVDAGLGVAEGASGDKYIAELIAAEDVATVGLAPVEKS